MTQGKYKDLGLYSEDIYQNRMKVIGEFICDKVYSIKNRGFCFSVATEGESITDEIARQSCLDYDDMVSYLGNKDGYGLHITDLKIYDKPKKLSEFRAYNFKSMNGTDVCGNYDCKYYQDSGSYMIPPSCAKNGCRITRPPQSWQYVEEL